MSGIVGRRGEDGGVTKYIICVQVITRRQTGFQLWCFGLTKFLIYDILEQFRNATNTRPKINETKRVSPRAESGPWRAANSVFNVAAINTHRGRSCPVTSKGGPDKQQTTGKKRAKERYILYLQPCIFISLRVSIWGNLCLIDRLAAPIFCWLLADCHLQRPTLHGKKRRGRYLNAHKL